MSVPSGKYVKGESELRFFVSEPHNEKAPIPTQQGIEIRNIPEIHVYVK